VSGTAAPCECGAAPQQSSAPINTGIALKSFLRNMAILLQDS
jgi:hypothetical protein